MAFAIGALTASSAFAQAPPTGPLILHVPASARTAALGNAWVAGRDQDVVFHNPAQLIGTRPGFDLSVTRLGPASTMTSIGSVFAAGKWSLTFGWGAQLLGFNADAATSYPYSPDLLQAEGSRTGTSALVTAGAAVLVKKFRIGVSAKYASDLAATSASMLLPIRANQHVLLADVGVARNLNGLSAENDGRAWLLLKHLEAWKTFNETADGPFFNRVDMNNIAVMGHSRGGEAAATAAAFNRLKYYPDDFKQEFTFNFGIKSVVAIAPVDGQYKPSSVFTPLENANYLIIHGSHDGDVSTAVGARQYERLQFTDGQPWFKAMIFMYRANHGQWNTVWQNKDNGPRSGRSLDLRTLIDGEAQRQMAKVVISGFLEATLHQKREYVPMFRDHRTAGAWLPKTLYTTKFQENGFKSLASFDRDAQRFSNIFELIPQTFVMPLADFAQASPEFDPRQLATIRLVFDRTEAGTIVLEHVGLSTPTDAAFLAAPVP
ncbi:MAG: hypothetical protein NUW22_00455 [Acidobacteria bacterium]|nr:hypothetical protein [Acidobacteriota bacterium]